MRQSSQMDHGIRIKFPQQAGHGIFVSNVQRELRAMFREVGWQNLVPKIS
jgi:hypothetical protein